MVEKKASFTLSKIISPKKYFIKTFGCQMNVSDSERIAGFFETQKLKPAKKIQEANLAIFNTCGVRQMAEDRVYGQIHNLKKINPKIKIILTGCLAERKDVQKKLKEKVNLFISIKDFFKIENLKLIENSKLKIENSNTEKCDYLELPPNYQNKFRAYVPIMTGCNNFCSYCVVPYARGREISRPVQNILKEIENLANNKYKEIILLGQNVNSYLYEISPSLLFSLEKKYKFKKKSNFSLTKTKKITFPLLLNFLAQYFPKINFSFLTSHPKDFSEDLMRVIAKNKNISHKIHLPIQSGSNKILCAMNRPYNRKHYLNLIKKAQKIIPGVMFTTDVIVGFPGETEKDFLQTVDIFQKVNYQEAYINKYSPRPNTSAIRLGDPISWEEKKRREKILREILKKNKKL